EEAAPVGAHLRVAVAPVARLPGAQAGELDPVHLGGGAQREHRVHVGAQVGVHAGLAPPALDVVVALADAADALVGGDGVHPHRARPVVAGEAGGGDLRGAAPAGADGAAEALLLGGLGRVYVAPLLAAQVLPGELEAQVLTDQVRGAELALEGALAPAAQGHRGGTLVTRALGWEVKDPV